jgi:hypothetical protein
MGRLMRGVGWMENRRVEGLRPGLTGENIRATGIREDRWDRGRRLTQTGQSSMETGRMENLLRM